MYGLLEIITDWARSRIILRGTECQHAILKWISGNYNLTEMIRQKSYCHFIWSDILDVKVVAN